MCLAAVDCEHMRTDRRCSRLLETQRRRGSAKIDALGHGCVACVPLLKTMPVPDVNGSAVHQTRRIRLINGPHFVFVLARAGDRPGYSKNEQADTEQRPSHESSPLRPREAL